VRGARRPRPTVPVAVPAYAFAVIANVNMFSFFALAPTFRDDLGLSGTERDILFLATGATQLVMAMPLGSLADRFGSRQITMISIGLLALSALGHAVAVDLWSLLAARVVFSAAFTGMVTAAIAWLASAVRPERRAHAIGGIIPCAGVGQLAGPYLTGALTDASGTTLAYAVLVVLSLVPLALAFFTPEAATEAAAARTERTPMSVSLRALRAPIVLVAVVLTILGIVYDTTLSLLVPQQLDDNGLSAGARGAILSAGAAVYLVAALLAVRRAHRLTSVRGAAVCAALAALVLVPAVLSDASAAQAATMVARGAVLSVLFVVSFPLGTLGANASGVPLGAATGLLTLATGVAATATPLAAGRAADALGSTIFYAILGGAAIAASVWMLRVRRTEAAAAAGPAA